MSFHLVQRRTVRCPTVLGWLCLFGCVCAPFVFWWYDCESFLCRTQRLPAEVLVVEGWIGEQGIQAAAEEFKQGGYQYLVTTGGPTSDLWSPQQWNYAEMAQETLINAGIPKDKIIAAPSKTAESQRTFAAAAAAGRALQARGIRPKAINLFTLGAHARRSRLIFAKTFPPGTQVGVISWPPLARKTGPWWRSSERAEDIIKETVGYFFELLLNSGRKSSSPFGPTPAH
jgi:hypothetical protein